jgi:predicted metalloendopeptidase
MFRLATWSALLLLAPLLSAGAQTSTVETSTAAPHGLDLGGMDRSAKPGDAFYQYANGTWLKQTEIPPDRSTYGAGAILTDIVDRQVAELIQQAAERAAPSGSEQRKIGDFYASFMDTTAIDAAGLKPLQPTLDSIAVIHDRAELAQFLGSTLRADIDALNATNFYTENLFGLWVAQDLNDPTRYSPFLFQGGLGMPERSYYLDSSATMVTIRGKYRDHIAAMLGLAGVPDTAAKAAAIAALETRIAQVHWARQASGDVAKGNNHWARADFNAKAPGLDWDRYFAAAGLAQAPRVAVWQPGAITGISALTASEPLDTWKAYLTYHAIQSRAALLPRPFDRESFAFYGPALTGAKQQRDRWRRAVAATNEALGFAVGRLYVARYFPPAKKARAQAMVRNLIAAFRTRLDRLDWMAASTRREAKAKLGVLRVGVGYPDTWPAYDDLEVVAGDAYGNTERARLRHLRLSLARLGRPVDRGEWVMTPQTVNAVNLPAMNALNFPAAILQPPYFDPQRPLAMDYGAIGAVIGHEVSHSFDNPGALFDARGRLRNWWTPADFRHFKASSQQLVAQYDAYRPFPDLAVKGQQTLGENIADLAGLTASYDAFHRALGGRPAPKADGFAGDQQFFISYAQSWRGKSRDLALRNRILTDGHAPPQYRALTVRNIDAWYQAFGVKPGDSLYLAPANRVRVW